MMPYLTEDYGNAGSIYKFGRKANSAVKKAREQVATLFNCPPENVIFTSGGSESNNTVFKGLRQRLIDIGKPLCYTEDENGGHFYGHAVPGREISETVMNRLRFDNKTKDEVLELILYHDALIEPTPKTVRRWLNKIGEHRFSQLLDIRMADIKAHAYGTQESRIKRCIALGVLTTEILEQEQCFSMKDLAIKGKDILDFGVPEGKLVGEILKHILNMVINEELDNDIESQVEEVKRYLEAMKDG